MAVLAVTLAACAGTSGATSTVTSSTDAAASPEIVVSPEFINGVIPDSRLVLLAGLADTDQGPVAINAEVTGAEVVVEPPEISGSEVAEVTIVPEATTTETDLDVTITAAVGDQTFVVTRTVTVMPWEDDREDQARQILALFTGWIADAHPELGITDETAFDGTYTAPMLLVVSHYTFFSDDWEVGVSWHIMVPPDDFAEMYLRPRTGLAPTHAYRIGSWQTALDTGSVDVTEVPPPIEVVR